MENKKLTALFNGENSVIIKNEAELAQLRAILAPMGLAENMQTYSDYVLEGQQLHARDRKACKNPRCFCLEINPYWGEEVEDVYVVTYMPVQASKIWYGKRPMKVKALL